MRASTIAHAVQFVLVCTCFAFVLLARRDDDGQHQLPFEGLAFHDGSLVLSDELGTPRVVLGKYNHDWHDDSPPYGLWVYPADANSDDVAQFIVLEGRPRIELVKGASRLVAQANEDVARVLAFQGDGMQAALSADAAGGQVHIEDGSTHAYTTLGRVVAPGGRQAFGAVLANAPRAFPSFAAERIIYVDGDVIEESGD